jgi:two-component system sensor histidine kinase KdpD
MVAAGLLVLVAAREPVRQHLDYAVPVLLVLVLVIAGALLGGIRVALPGAVAGVLLLNWFFTVPFGSLWVESSEQVVVLLVFLVVAVAVSWVVDAAARGPDADRHPPPGAAGVRHAGGGPARAGGDRVGCRRDQ